MASFFNGLPLALLLAALVGIYLSLWRETRTSRFKLWLTGWVMITAHSILRLIPGSGPLSTSLLQTLYSAALGISGLAFLLSFSEIVDLPAWRNRVFVSVAGPLVILGALMAFHVQNRWVYFCVAACCYFGGAAGHWFWHIRKTPFAILITLFTMSFGACALVRIMAGDFEGAFYLALLSIYLTSAMLSMRTLHRLSPGSVAIVGGFVTWAAVWAIYGFVPKALAIVGQDSELWNVPKILVAFGMIVVELEDRSQTARRAELRERNLSRQVSCFAELTSKLLSGVEPFNFSRDIAREIVDVGNFGRAVILLADDAGRFVVSGTAGLPPDHEARIRDAVLQASLDVIGELIKRGRNLGPNSAFCDLRHSASYPLLQSARAGIKNGPWGENEFLLIPLRSPLGNILGCICLDDPKDPSLLTAEDMGAVEMLASDLAIAVEKASMQRKVLLHEKLASVGQLVNGVAHELNNPLTVILGYTDLLNSANPDGPHARELGIMRKEAMRMRSIIDNLLRFARQSKVQTRSANLLNTVRDAIGLREYDLARHNITVERDVPADLPAVRMDEAQLKTVIVNLLNNACDAVLKADERTITLFARQIGDRVIFSVVDTGPGFADLNRAFDPFFSTKELGHGPGLGLSICYGIVKQFGGEIYAQNAVPKGACVTMELGIAEQASTTATK